MNFTSEVNGVFWDGPVVAFDVQGEPVGAGFGMEITDFGGRLSRPSIALCIERDGSGRKVFLSRKQALDLAEELSKAAELLANGATSMVRQ